MGGRLSFSMLCQALEVLYTKASDPKYGSERVFEKGCPRSNLPPRDSKNADF
jgi:hypothetical protein